MSFSALGKSLTLPDGITVRRISVSELVPRPWKNGGGTTREIASEADAANAGGFLWRFSCADVTDEGPFSTFENTDRIITLIKGETMILHDDNAKTQHTLLFAAPFHFAGEARMRASLPAGPTQDINLMWHRQHIKASLDQTQTNTERTIKHGNTLLYCVRGAHHIFFTSDSGNTPLREEQTPSWSLSEGETLHINATGHSIWRFIAQASQPHSCLLIARLQETANLPVIDSE